MPSPSTNSSFAFSSARYFLAVLTMLTVAPIIAVTTLVLWNPERWGGSASPLAILGMALFGLITTPLWPTFIPAVVLAPMIVGRVARQPWYRSSPLALVLGIALVLGFPAGVGVISIIVPWRESADLVFNWVTAGGVSGGVTLMIMACIFYYVPARTPRE